MSQKPYRIPSESPRCAHSISVFAAITCPNFQFLRGLRRIRTLNRCVEKVCSEDMGMSRGKSRPDSLTSSMLLRRWDSPITFSSSGISFDLRGRTEYLLVPVEAHRRGVL